MAFWTRGNEGEDRRWTMTGPDDLTTLLGAEPPAAVRRLPEEVRARLARQLAEAKQREQRDIEAAVKTAVNGVPLPVRGIVRKALLG